MLIWVARISEYYPLQFPQRRPRRVEMLLRALVDRDHRVLMWASTFDHITKSHVYRTSTTVSLNGQVEARYLHAPSYSRNVSVRRLMNHYVAGRLLERGFQQGESPDLIYSCLPTTEFCDVCTRVGAARKVPVVIDVRDLWPDAFLGLLPAPCRLLGAFCLSPYFRAARRALQRCTSIIAVSQSYLDWALRLAGRPKGELDKVFPLGYVRPAATLEQKCAAEAELRAVGVEPSKILCWFSGVFGATYDLPLIIEAARLFQNEGNESVQFVLSGDGDQYAECVRQAAGLKNVVFTGWVDGSKIAWLMEVADVGLATYVADAPQGLPNKIFEYMAAGVPIISSLQGDMCELLKQHRFGYSYEAGNVRDFAGIVRALAADEKERKFLGGRAKWLYERQFTAKTVYEGLASHLEEVRTAFPTGRC
jgi:glycosyltransferase involved in cell wall biosynthesis